MTRWNWNWDERPGADSPAPDTPQGSATAQSAPTATVGGLEDAGSRQPPDAGQGGPQRGFAHRQLIRRRRAGGLLALLAILVAPIVVVAYGASGGAHRRLSKTASASSGSDGRTDGTGRAPAQSPAALARAEEGAINHVLSYTPAVVAGGRKGNEVALTFDDGPGPYTQALVAKLDSLHVHATFFAIGEMERYFSAGTQAELRSGDAVEDHTETHPMLTSLSRREQREQLFEQIVRVEVLGVPRPRLWRPPYGAFNATTLAQARTLHLLMVLWSADTADYTVPGVHAIVERALAGAHPGAIILMHDGGGNRSDTIAALPAIVAGLRKRGLHPVTVPQLMLDDPPPPGEPLPSNLSGD